MSSASGTADFIHILSRINYIIFLFCTSLSYVCFFGLNVSKVYSLVDIVLLRPPETVSNSK